jgi:PAS domain S-box-containing protein
MASDSDALRRTTEALRASEERLHLATAAANLGIFDVDLITQAMEWEARQRELWGVAPDVVITDEIFMAGIHPEDRDLVRAALARAFDSGGDHLYEAEYRLLPRSNGSDRWIAATGRVHFDGLQPVRLIGTVQDVSSRKRPEMGLRELNEKLEERVAAALAARQLLELSRGFHREVSHFSIWFSGSAWVMAGLDPLATLFCSSAGTCSQSPDGQERRGGLPAQQ